MMGQVVSLPGVQHRPACERPNQHVRTPEAAALRAEQRKVRELNKWIRHAREHNINIKVSVAEYVPEPPPPWCTDSPRPWR